MKPSSSSIKSRKTNNWKPVLLGLVLVLVSIAAIVSYQRVKAVTHEEPVVAEVVAAEKTWDEIVEERYQKALASHKRVEEARKINGQEPTYFGTPTVVCPECKERIAYDARRCKHCTARQDE